MEISHTAGTLHWSSSYLMFHDFLKHVMPCIILQQSCVWAWAYKGNCHSKLWAIINPQNKVPFFFFTSCKAKQWMVKIWVKFLGMSLKYEIYDHRFLFGWFQKLLLRFSVYSGTICIPKCPPWPLSLVSGMAQCTIATGFSNIELCSPLSGTLYFRIKNLNVVFLS